jgi:ankyrin repeat protein
MTSRCYAEGFWRRFVDRNRYTAWRRFMRTIPFGFIRIAVFIMVALAWGNLAAGGEIDEAAKRGDLEKVKALLKANPALALSKDDTDWKPLHLAAQKGFKDITKLLLDHKAEVNGRSKRADTPLHWAAGNGHKEIVELLLANKADVNAQDNGGWTPLHMAARSGCKEIVQILLVKKAQVNLKDNTGITPRSRAMMQGHRDVAELLWLHGGRA